MKQVTSGRRKIWISIGVIWTALLLVMPQIPVEIFQAQAPRLHALHPFYYWHLFTDIGTDFHRFNLEIRNCPGPETLPRPGLPLLFPGGVRYRTFHRLSYVGALFEGEDRALAQATLRKVVDQSFRRFKGCEAVLFWNTNRDPQTLHYLEESRLEI